MPAVSAVSWSRCVLGWALCDARLRSSSVCSAVASAVCTRCVFVCVFRLSPVFPLCCLLCVCCSRASFQRPASVVETACRPPPAVCAASAPRACSHFRTVHACGDRARAVGAETAAGTTEVSGGETVTAGRIGAHRARTPCVCVPQMQTTQRTNTNKTHAQTNRKTTTHNDNDNALQADRSPGR